MVHFHIHSAQKFELAVDPRNSSLESESAYPDTYKGLFPLNLG